MNKIKLLSALVHSVALFLFTTGALGGAPARETTQPALHPKLEPLRPLLGKTWKGAFKNSTPEKPVVDVLKIERALNGQAVRMLHSINNGMYGGETLIVVDGKSQKVVYYYFTTAGFMTTGTMEFEGNRIVTVEKVQGSSGGVEEVKGESEILPGGKFHVKTKHLKNGEWLPGHEVTYEPDPGAEPRFK